MKRFFSIILVCVTFFCSCSDAGNGDTVFTLSIPDNCKFMDGTVKVSYEIVQPQADCLDAFMGSISKVIEHKGYMYIMAAQTNSMLQTNTIFIFTDSGEFIKKFSLGRGAGEFPVASGMNIDKENDILEVYSMFTSGIYRYTLDGEFIEMIELPRKTYIGMEKSGGCYLLYTPRITAKNSHYFHLYNPQSGELKSYFEGVELPLSTGSAIYKDKDGKFCFQI